MKLHTLKPAAGSVKTNKRLGRGQGSGGSTAGRGHKGAQSRSGYHKKIGFEGGQMPLQRRIPKFGFKNNNKVYFKSINLDVLEELAQKTKASAIDVTLMMFRLTPFLKQQPKPLKLQAELQQRFKDEAFLHDHKEHFFH
jgi:large subunit ribosomal protein L15